MILDRLFSAHSFNTCEDMVEVDAESSHTLPPASPPGVPEKAQEASVILAIL